jgi:hypothetical protein
LYFVASIALYVRPGFGVPLSLVARVVLKIALDTTGCVHFRNPHGAGGLYYVFNAVMTHVACFVAAKLYSAYGLAPDNESRSTTGSNFTAANTTFPANGTAVDYARADFGQIGNFTLVGA